MTTRIIDSPADRTMLLLFLKGKNPPYTITITDGKHRTNEQNKLQRKWISEISEQLGDQTFEEVRGYCKLTIGVPILREQNEDFCETYDRVIKPLSYEHKLQMMMEPIDVPITRIMNTKQKTEYLDGIHRHFSSQGIILTIPEPHRAISSGRPLPAAKPLAGASPVSASASNMEKA